MARIQKLAIGFAALFLTVYLLDYVPGIMGENGKMFGLFSMTPIVDIGHLVLGALALVSGMVSAKWARIYFWALGSGMDRCAGVFRDPFQTISLITNVLINLPHAAISIAAFFNAARVDRDVAQPRSLHATQSNP